MWYKLINDRRSWSPFNHTAYFDVYNIYPIHNRVLRIYSVKSLN